MKFCKTCVFCLPKTRVIDFNGLKLKGIKPNPDFICKLRDISISESDYACESHTIIYLTENGFYHKSNNGKLTLKMNLSKSERG